MRLNCSLASIRGSHWRPDGERLTRPGPEIGRLERRDLGNHDDTPSFRGEVRLGVPLDIVTHYTPPILRRFNNAWPHVRVSLQPGNSKELLEDLDSGAIDLTLTTDLEPQRQCETLRRDSLVWVGVDNSTAHMQRPLPISIGGKSCRFRPVVMTALGDRNIDWRVVLQVTNQEAVNATVAAGLAVTAMLQRQRSRQALPFWTRVAVCRPLPEFEINLYLPKTGASELGLELARQIRADFAARFGLARANADSDPVQGSALHDMRIAKPSQ